MVDDSTFRIIHGVLGDGLSAQLGPRIHAAGQRGGAHLVRYHGSDGGWHRSTSASESRARSATGFKGSGNVAIGGVGGDPYAYIATVEPFHGNTVAVYTKEQRRVAR